MYKVDKTNKIAIKIPETTFAEMGIKERYDIQEWIANDPSILEYGELLIIQKEFDGFQDTSKRLDLLGIDKKGNLIIIENKRDDTGTDVTGQAINYASFCSTLTKQDVIRIYQEYLRKINSTADAEESLNDFFEDSSLIYPTNIQRIVLVAKEFRKEVLSSVQWLNNNGLDITCIKLTPHNYNGEILLDVNRILPQEETKDYTIKLAQKKIEQKNEVDNLRTSEDRNVRFWRFMRNHFDITNTIFENITTWDNRTRDFIGASSGIIRAIQIYFAISRKEARVDFYINDSDKQYNKQIFDALYSKKDEIEQDCRPYEISWQRLDNKTACRISIKYDDKLVSDEENWLDIVNELIKYYNLLYRAVNKHKNLLSSIR